MGDGDDRCPDEARSRLQERSGAEEGADAERSLLPTERPLEVVRTVRVVGTEFRLSFERPRRVDKAMSSGLEVLERFRLLERDGWDLDLLRSRVTGARWLLLRPRLLVVSHGSLVLWRGGRVVLLWLWLSSFLALFMRATCDGTLRPLSDQVESVHVPVILLPPLISHSAVKVLTTCRGTSGSPCRERELELFRAGNDLAEGLSD